MFAITVIVLFTFTACDRTEESSWNGRGDPIVIRIGTHNRPAHDPTWRDPLTGEPGMTPEGIRLGEIALQRVLDELNVRLEWVQYPGDVREVLLRSVLAGDPFCDIAFLWGGSPGTIIMQNILQDLSQFADIFEGDPDADRKSVV